MFFFEVRYHPDPNCEYPCYQHPDPESAITYFNSEYGPKAGKQFTTEPNEYLDRDYALLEQQKPPPGSCGLREVREIPLYERK